MGIDEKKSIREFVDGYLLARDSRALREHIRDTQPDVDLNCNSRFRRGGKGALLGLTFFGLTPDLAPQIRVNVFKQIHEILFHGKGWVRL